jgi:hypothetical protein
MSIRYAGQMAVCMMMRAATALRIPNASALSVARNEAIQERSRVLPCNATHGSPIPASPKSTQKRTAPSWPTGMSASVAPTAACTRLAVILIPAAAFRSARTPMVCPSRSQNNFARIKRSLSSRIRFYSRRRDDYANGPCSLTRRRGSNLCSWLAIFSAA